MSQNKRSFTTGKCLDLNGLCVVVLLDICGVNFYRKSYMAFDWYKNFESARNLYCGRRAVSLRTFTTRYSNRKCP